MHERTQRAIARLLFVFCCAIPTLVTTCCVITTWTPWYHQRALRALEAAASRETSLVVSIDDFGRSSPSTLRLFGVRVLDPETNREIARVREMQWVTRDDESAILLLQPELQSRELLGTWHLVHDRFLCRPDLTSTPVKISASDMTVHSKTGALTLRDVDCWVGQRDRVVEATLQCLPANGPSGQTIAISARRDRRGELPLTQWTLDTHGIALPCSALAEFLPLMESLGAESIFSGTLAWQGRGQDWSIDLGGSRFEQVSLDRLFEHQSHRLSGMASLGLERCRIEPQQRRSDIAGWIQATDGFVGRSMLVAVNRHLGFDVKIPPDVADARGDVPYDHLSLGFSINDTRLTLNGLCRMEPGYKHLTNGIVLRLGMYPLVRSMDQPLDSLQLIRAIAPSHAVDVPMSTQTRALMDIFIPPSKPQMLNETNPPYIRSARSHSGGPSVGQPR